jgi:hypothetical protein
VTRDLSPRVHLNPLKKQLPILLPLCFALAACGGGGSSDPGGGGTPGDTEGTLSESFDSTSMRVDATSTAGIWSGNGHLDCGLNPLTGKHLGGGHGLLGELRFDSSLQSLDTDSQVIYSELLASNVTVEGTGGGVFFVASANLPASLTVAATGDNPLQIVTRGSLVLDGVLDVSGEDAPVNFPMNRPSGERLHYASLGSSEPSTEMRALLANNGEAIGGDGGAGQLAAGSGGRGGAGWYLFPGYFDSDLDGWYAYHAGGTDLPDPTRFTDGLGGEDTRPMHGENGGRVGGEDPQGDPLPASAALNIPSDLAAGSGMGSWAWPPKSNRIPLETEVGDGTWAATSNGYDIVAYHWGNWVLAQFSRARSRGGGGGGYWTGGGRGDFHEEGSDAVGDALPTPDLMPSYSGAQVPENWDFNGELAYSGDASLEGDRDSWTSYLTWDDLGAGSVEDAEGGGFLPDAGGAIDFYTLDPSSGYLRGGAGGGGAGMSQHGSFNSVESGGSAAHSIESYRTSDGAGGGAGGGAVRFHVGNDLQWNGQIYANGGDGGDSAAIVSSSYSIDPVAWEHTLPGDAGGGGGAGGGVLMQVGGNLTFGSQAELQLDGGRGGLGAVGNDGGAGGIGVLRMETSSALSLNDMTGVVEPIESFDLAQRSEFGLTGANWNNYRAEFPGDLGDLTVARALGGGFVTFNGNASGVESGWYELQTSVGSATLLGYTIKCAWSDGAGGSGTLTFSTSERTFPGQTPIWIAIQIDDSTVAGASPQPWIIPGYNTISGGATELGEHDMKRVRFQLVFDHDVIASFIGNNPNATFYVTKVNFPWEK